jgi:hypothetical protein
VSEILAGVELLHRMARPRHHGSLQRFRDAFISRYERREIPLVEALDEEAGIGFEAADDTSPLLQGLDFPSPPDEMIPWGSRESLLLRKPSEALSHGGKEIVLRPADIEEMAAKAPLPLPGAFEVTATVTAPSESAVARGDFRILLRGTRGPSGARLLGRFCHGDATLRAHVEAHLRAEEALQPEALFAEIVHLPQGRLGNILLRPVLRDYEIPYLGRSSVPAERQIPITDLLVSVAGERGEVVLRSARLGRRVIPRLTSAHNFEWESLGIYRFLCALQSQGVAGEIGWDWGYWGTPHIFRGLSPGGWCSRAPAGGRARQSFGSSAGTRVRRATGPFRPGARSGGSRAGSPWPTGTTRCRWISTTRSASSRSCIW